MSRVGTFFPIGYQFQGPLIGYAISHSHVWTASYLKIFWSSAPHIIFDDFMWFCWGAWKANMYVLIALNTVMLGPVLKRWKITEFSLRQRSKIYIFVSQIGSGFRWADRTAPPPPPPTHTHTHTHIPVEYPPPPSIHCMHHNLGGCTLLHVVMTCWEYAPNLLRTDVPQTI